MDLSTYRRITLDEIKTLPNNVRQAAHAMIYTKFNSNLFGIYPIKSTVMMQLRFDGAIGFVGGIVDEGESPEEACTRECCEELGVTQSALSITKDHYLFTHYSEHTKYCLHFYAIEVPYKLYTDIEAQTLQSQDWGKEVMGLIRCPIYTLPNGMGLPAFLKHDFIGNARVQFLQGLEITELLTSEEIIEAVATSKKLNSMVTVKNSMYDENMETAIVAS